MSRDLVVVGVYEAKKAIDDRLQMAISKFMPRIIEQTKDADDPEGVRNTILLHFTNKICQDLTQEMMNSGTLSKEDYEKVLKLL